MTDIREEFAFLIKDIAQDVFFDGLPDNPTNAVSIHVLSGNVMLSHPTGMTSAYAASCTNHDVLVSVRNEDPDMAREIIEAICRVLNGVSNTVVLSGSYARVLQASPFSITARDPGGTTVYSVPFSAIRRNR